MPKPKTIDAYIKDSPKSAQFPYDKPLPKSLIQKIAKYRVKEVKAGSLWMHKGKK